MKRSGWALAIVWLAALAAFVALAVRASTGGVLSVDISLARHIQAGPRALGWVSNVANELGAPGPFLAVIFVGVAVLLLRRCFLEAAILATTLIAGAIDEGLKLLVDEPRPRPDLIEVRDVLGNPGFPSGHTYGITMLYGLLFAFAPRLVPHPVLATGLRLLCLFPILMMGVARVWVGAHWPSQVLGGYVLALLFLIPALAVHRLLASGRLG